MAWANCPTSTTSWPQTTSSLPVPASRRVTGRSSTASLAIRSTVGAVGALPGERGEPVDRLGQALEQRVVGGDGRQLDALGQVGVPLQARPSDGAPSSSARSRRSGVNRHSSSRPVGRGKASGSVEVNRSAGEPVGAGPPCECAPGGVSPAVPVPGAGVVGGPACAPTPGANSSEARAADSAGPATVAGRGSGSVHQPTAPSICSSIRRFSSRAYSIGSSRAIGSTKPRTIIAIASSSVRPRLIR